MNKIKCIAVIPIWQNLKPCKPGDVIELDEKDYNRKLKSGKVKPLPKVEQKQTVRKATGKRNARTKKS